MKRTGNMGDIICSVILLLFLYTALSKLADHERFRDALHSAGVFPNNAGLVAWAVPVTELMIVMLLLIPATRLKGLYASLVLLILFTLYISWMILFAAHLPCNCGGVISQLSWKQHVLFNMFFIGMSITGIYRLKKQSSIQKDIQH